MIDLSSVLIKKNLCLLLFVYFDCIFWRRIKKCIFQVDFQVARQMQFQGCLRFSNLHLSFKERRYVNFNFETSYGFLHILVLINFILKVQHNNTITWHFLAILCVFWDGNAKTLSETTTTAATNKQNNRIIIHSWGILLLPCSSNSFLQN
jgi:hypothetical protein